MKHSDEPTRMEIAVRTLQALQNSTDPEEAHVIADKILCRFLRDLGCDELVKAWEKVPKFYA